MSQPDIIYEDEQLLAVNKPAGISVHPSSNEPSGTLSDWLLERYPELKGVGDPLKDSGQEIRRPGIVHRLDKDTSGLLVVARTQEAFEGLKALFKERHVEKHYLAIVVGVIKEPRGKIDFPLGRVGLKVGVVRPGQRELPKQRDAVTTYIVRKRFSDATHSTDAQGHPRSSLSLRAHPSESKTERGRGATFVEVLPKTGRMHQIRVHMTAIGRPILGDKLYGGKAVRARASRQMLHAWKLSFTLQGTEYAFEVEPPDDFEELLNSLAERSDMGQDIGAD